MEKNYFYVFPEEQEKIKRIALKILVIGQDEEKYGNNILKNLIFDYLFENNRMILEGFVNFRIKEYIEIIDYVVELAVTSYLSII